MTITSPHPYDRHISPVLLTVTSPRPANRHISPFEGGWGDVINSSTHRQIGKSTHRQINSSTN